MNHCWNQQKALHWRFYRRYEAEASFKRRDSFGANIDFDITQDFSATNERFPEKSHWRVDRIQQGI
jgi:hypothetical protein